MEPDGSMDAEERVRLEAWVAEKWQHGPCPVCNTNDWNINPKIGQIINAATMAGGTSYPVLLISCTNCGNTLSINAVIAGVLSGDDDADEATRADAPAEVDGT
jgi:hypothetical protein